MRSRLSAVARTIATVKMHNIIIFIMQAQNKMYSLIPRSHTETETASLQSSLLFETQAATFGG